MQCLERAFAVLGGLHGDAEHADHRKAAVLKLGSLQLEERLGGRGAARKVQGVEVPARVGSFVRVELRGALDFGEAHGEDFDEHQSLERHVDVEAEVGGLLVEHLAGVRPADAGGLLGEDHTNQAEHRPAGVLELALAEAHDVEGLVEGLCGGGMVRYIKSGDDAEKRKYEK